MTVGDSRQKTSLFFAYLLGAQRITKRHRRQDTHRSGKQPEEDERYWSTVLDTNLRSVYGSSD